MLAKNLCADVSSIMYVDLNIKQKDTDRFNLEMAHIEPQIIQNCFKIAAAR